MSQEVNTNSDDAPATGEALGDAIEGSISAAVKEQMSGTTDGEPGGKSDTPPEPQAEGGEGESDAATAKTTDDNKDDDSKGEDPKPDDDKGPKQLTPEQLQAAQEAVIIEALRQDPVNTVKQLAQMAGFQITEPGSDAPSTKAEKAEVKEDLKAELNSALGEEITEKLLPTLEKIIDGRVKVVTEPYIRAQELSIQQAVERETKNILDTFTQKHPDWKEYENEMTALAQKFRAAPGTDEIEYMEFLYNNVAKRVAHAESVKADADRVNKAAQAAATNPKGSVPDKTVVEAPPKTDNFDEALERGIRAAVRGEKFAIPEN